MVFLWIYSLCFFIQSIRLNMLNGYMDTYIKLNVFNVETFAW